MITLFEKSKRLLWIILAAITMASCNSNPANPTPTPTSETTSSPPQFLRVQATPTATILRATALPRIISRPTLAVLATQLSEPDDLLLAPDGSIYLSDVTDGTISQLSQAGGLQLILSDLSVPEGMLILPNGFLIVAEQGKNRLVRYDPIGKALTSFLVLHNTTGQAGVDGLAFDSKSQTIIVPDSPNGTILRVSLDGGAVTEIADGFARPTGAWVEADGSILVVDENANSLSRIHPNGGVEKLADLPTPDDVIEDDNGNILVNTIGDGAIHLISAGTPQGLILAAGLSEPQGITFDTDGNLIVADAGHHRLVRLILH
jgi:hypothetical protein